MDTLKSLLALDWVAILAAISMIVTGLSAITTMTPNKSDDAVVNAVLKALNFLSLNFGRNKNGT